MNLLKLKCEEFQLENTLEVFLEENKSERAENDCNTKICKVFYTGLLNFNIQ